MLSKLILSASAATMLFAAQAVADNNNGQPPIIKQPSGQNAQPSVGKEMGAGQGANQQMNNADQGQGGAGQKMKPQNSAQDQDNSGNMQMNGQNNEAADQGATKKKLKGNETEQSQDNTKANSNAEETQAQTGESNQQLKKKKNADQVQQGENAGQVNKKKVQNSENNTNENMTTGSTSKAAKVEITQKNRTVIRNTIIKDTHVTRIDRKDIDVDINVGVMVPHTIALAPLPVAVLDVVPEYRGYDYFVLADGTIVIVDPGSYEIVYVIAA